ncbi:MAG: GTP-binding protein [Opitutales bacterium]
MALPRFILVGGFLGAGKTSLLASAATRLAARGQRVGLITNDQAMNLVDTATLEAAGFRVGEVSGGCFCCKFDTLLQALQQLGEAVAPDYFLCEPVGSCTDLVATVAAPLRTYFADRYAVAPATALVDPARLARLTGPLGERPFPESVFYIFRKQLEEADCLLLSQADRHDPVLLRNLTHKLRAEFPDRHVQTISTVTGEGIDRWLNQVTDPAATPGLRMPEVDYEVYAEGEGMLGWLNATVGLKAKSDSDGLAHGRAFFARLIACLLAEGAEIAHAKAYLATRAQCLRLNRIDRRADFTQQRDHGRARMSPGEALLEINVRALTSPQVLRTHLQAQLQSSQAGAGVRFELKAMAAFRPAAPQPTHRFASRERAQSADLSQP